jgi:hypothetical protein
MSFVEQHVKSPKCAIPRLGQGGELLSRNVRQQPRPRWGIPFSNFLCKAFLVLFALTPLAAFAQQDQNPPAAAQQAKPDAEQKQPEEAQAKPGEDGKLQSVPGSKALGMSILGNQEAPKALVIVPWKRSELGNVQGISTLLDDSRLPIDKEVFMRMLSYYEITQETARPGGAPAKTNATQPAAAPRRK